MNKKKYNFFGDDITNTMLELLDVSYGYIDANNIPHINWEPENDVIDIDGFDKRFVSSDLSDSYVIENYLLPKGTIICRYGFDGGRFTTVKGSDYDKLGLPYDKSTIEYHEYKVTEDLRINCYVTKGITAPMFSSKGGAVQFKHKQSIFLECEDGYLQEDYSWIQKNT